MLGRPVIRAKGIGTVLAASSLATRLTRAVGDPSTREVRKGRSMSRRMIAVFASIAVGLGLAACGSGGDEQPSAPVAAGDAGYPLKLVNCGRDLLLANAPERVVVMNTNSVAEVSTLLALGAEEHVISNAQNFGASDVPGRAAAINALPKGEYKPNDAQDIPRAAMLALKPDLVLANTETGFAPSLGFATRDELTKLGANTFVPSHNCVVPGAETQIQTTTIDDSYALLRDLGMLFNASEQADRVIAESATRIAAVQAKVKGRPAKKVLIALPGMGKGSGGDFAYVGAHGIWNDILAKAGGINPFDDPKGAATLTPKREQLVKADVDAVVFVNYRNPNPAKTVNGIFLAYPTWEAAKRKRYLTLVDSIYLGPSNDLAVERIAKMLHPKAF